MSKESLRRGLFLALTVVLAAFALYSMMVVVRTFTLSSAHDHHGWVLVAAIALVLACGGLAAWLARLSWRRAKSN
jgi:uncharacterized membrane protein YqjE